MKTLTLCFFLLAAGTADATETTVVATTATAESTRAVGQLNVNTASRDQLLRVPGLDATTADDLLRARTAAPLKEETLARLPEDVRAHLKTEGASSFFRIRQRPLRRLDESAISASR